MDCALFGVLGDSATLDGRPVLGFFERPDEPAEIEHIQTGVTEPRFSIRSSDLQESARGSVVVIDLPAPDGGTYKVIDPVPDGSGITVLRLKKS